MNPKTFLIVLFLGVFQAHPATTQSTPFPWQGTFAGINALSTESKNSQTSPFTQPSSDDTKLQPNDNNNSNPFALSSTSVSQINAQTTSQTIAQILANPATPLSQKANAAFTTSTSVGGTALKITPATKLRNTPVANALSNLTNISFTQVQKELAMPSKPLFANYPQIQTAYENFMNAMREAPGFLPLFKKIHITALHELYLYLTGIYTALNMTHVDDIKSYMITEKKYALNKKTLIINHLLTLVMAQLNQALRALIPGIPENYALNAGMACVQSDKISDLNMFILDMEQSVLAVLGIQKLDPSQITATYLALKHYIPLLNIPTSPELTAAINALGTTTFSAKSLSNDQATALCSALNTIITYLMQKQTTAQYQSIITLLTTPASNTTAQDVAFLKKFISQLVYGKPLEEEITFCHKCAKLLKNPSTATLTKEDVKKLKGIISYILERYETVSTKQISQIIQTLGELNPAYETLSPSQSLALKSLATGMLAKNNPLLLENLSDQQRSLLSYGLWVTSKKTTFSSTIQNTLQKLATTLKTSPMTEESLSQDQLNTLQQALTLFTTYTLSPLSSSAFEQQAQQRLTALNPNLSKNQQQTIISQALETINSGKFTSFNQLTQEEQVILLELFQMVDQVLETRLAKNKLLSSEVSHLFAGDIPAQKALFSSINSAQYETLHAIANLLSNTNDSLPLQKLIQLSPSSSNWMSPQDALLKLFTVPKSLSIKTKAQNIKGTSYLILLENLQKKHFSNPALQSILTHLSTEEIANYKNALFIINQSGASFFNMPETTRQSLAKTLSLYIEAQKKSTKQMYAGSSTLTDPHESALETVNSVVFYTHQNSNMRASFLWTLKQYLIFFNQYTQLLEVIHSDNETPASIGLTTFAKAATALQKTIAYDADAQDGLARLIEQTNPPLFFYDPISFRTIRLLPKLAEAVKKSSMAPYPTFGIEQAIQGSVIDPLTGQTITNTTTLGPTFSYKKFFFLEAPDATTEITDIAPSWIKKVIIPTSKGATILYEPNNKPNDGITGFYMNIPTFAQDPSNGNSALIRLYEQPIIAQPEWLNKTGTENKTPQIGIIPQQSAGVITLLRGCLGDFQSLLALNIFNPCLTVIFKKALSETRGNTQTKTTSVEFTQAETQQCSSYMKEKAKLIQKQENPVATTSINSLQTTPQAISTGGS